MQWNVLRETSISPISIDWFHWLRRFHKISTDRVKEYPSIAAMSSAGYVPLQQNESDEELGSAPPAAPKSWFVCSSWQRAVVLVLVGVLLVFLGFASCRFYWNEPASTSCCNSTFDYNSFYGIPKVLPVVNWELTNQTELDLKTGFVVSRTPTTRRYTFYITQALGAPDGFQRPMILINNQFPGISILPFDASNTTKGALTAGPLIEANSGDTIQVEVWNFMSNWSTSIHWHGIDQKNTTWMVRQRFMIAPAS